MLINREMTQRISRENKHGETITEIEEEKKKQNRERSTALLLLKTMSSNKRRLFL